MAAREMKAIAVFLGLVALSVALAIAAFDKAKPMPKGDTFGTRVPAFSLEQFYEQPSFTGKLEGRRIVMRPIKGTTETNYMIHLIVVRSDGGKIGVFEVGKPNAVFDDLTDRVGALDDGISYVFPDILKGPPRRVRGAIPAAPGNER